MRAQEFCYYIRSLILNSRKANFKILSSFANIDVRNCLTFFLFLKIRPTQEFVTINNKRKQIFSGFETNFIGQRLNFTTKILLDKNSHVFFSRT